MAGFNGRIIRQFSLIEQLKTILALLECRKEEPPQLIVRVHFERFAAPLHQRQFAVAGPYFIIWCAQHLQELS